MKFILKKFICFNKSILILLSIFLIIEPIKSNSLGNENISELSTYRTSSESEFKSNYILGYGDRINIEFVGIDDYSKGYLISPEGYLNLPEITPLYAVGYTLRELKEKLLIEYEKFIINPDFNLQIEAYRDVKAYISGEVNNPGLYNLGSNATLFSALQKAKGVTNNADLSNVEVVRKNSNTQGGGRIKTEINLLELITSGDQSMNIRILDSDYIFLKKSNNVIKEQILAINKTNLGPEFITVYITGNVVQPGQANLKKGTSLVQAIASNGGKKIMTGNVEFLRFNKDGVTKKRTFRYDENAKINSDKNPTLMDGDIINVRLTLFGTTTEIIREFASPIITGYGLFTFFEKL